MSRADIYHVDIGDILLKTAAKGTLRVIIGLAEKIPLPGSTRKQGRLVYRGMTDIFEPGILPGSLLERRSGLTKWGKGGCWDAGIQGIVWNIWRKLSE